MDDPTIAIQGMGMLEGSLVVYSPIDKHELNIELLHISTKAQMAVTATRGCVGVWDYMHGLNIPN